VTTNLPFSEWPQVFTNARLAGRARAAHRLGAHHRDRFRVVPLPENPAEEDEGLSPGVRFCFRSALRATLQQNRAPTTSTPHKGGPNKPPNWAKPSCQTQYRLYYRFLETTDEYFEYPSHASRQGRWNIYGIFLPEDVLLKVYRENALKLLSPFI
jgi:hypothetical protein